MIAPRSLAQRLAEARLSQLLPAAAATLRPYFPDVEVRTLAGRVDMLDVIEGTTFRAPTIALALVRWQAPVEVTGRWDLPVELAAYVITEEQVVGTKSIPREAVAHAIIQGLLEILTDLAVPRWGLSGVTTPRDLDGRPIFAAESYERGTAYFAVTWRQSICGLGADPLAPMPVTTVESVEDGAAVTWPPDLSGAPA